MDPGSMSARMKRGNAVNVYKSVSKYVSSSLWPVAQIPAHGYGIVNSRSTASQDIATNIYAARDYAKTISDCQS